jgi:DNA-binding NtrC family response regulator
MIKGTLLIVVRNRHDEDTLRPMLKNEVGKIISLSDPGRIYETLERNEVDIVLLEMDFRADIQSGNEGFYWMKEISKYDNTIPVIMITSNGDVELAVKAIREGATDFILKPWDQNKLLAAVNIAWKLRISGLETITLKNDNQYLKKEINKINEKFVQGASPTMINVTNIIKKVAATDANVLITGENGTGKELVAREIHNLSKRAGELMVSVDIGSITESLFESELFGHVKGAFTDARDDRKGKFEIAHNGTLFLDEIGNLSLHSQAKLLSVLQNRYVVKVGSNKPIPVDIRLICATNCDLLQMVREGKFREDLIYRINTILIEVPPLRDRVDDIPILANYFLKVHTERYGKNVMKISTHALEKLANHNWPGNVRELQHSIEKAVIMSDSPVLKPSDFIFGSSSRSALHSEITLEEMEKKMISEALKRHSNNLSIVANKLGITRQTLYNKIRKYNL